MLAVSLCKFCTRLFLFSFVSVPARQCDFRAAHALRLPEAIFASQDDAGRRATSIKAAFSRIEGKVFPLVGTALPTHPLLSCPFVKA
jgi:hypothetical protein